MTPRPDHDSAAGHGEWDSLAVGWAMSALDPEDEAVFLPHLADCDQCARTVAETTRTVGEMAWVVPDEAPPLDLRDRLMSAVYSEPRGGMSGSAPPHRPSGSGAPPPRAAPPPTPLAPAGPPVSPQPPAPVQPVVPRPLADDRPPADDRPGRHAAPGPDVVVPFRRRLTRDWRPLTAAAAVLALVVGLGGWNLRLRGDQDQLQRRVAQREAVIQELTRPGTARIVPLDSPTGQRLATVVARANGVDVVTEALPPTSGDSSYWVWAMNSPTDPNPQAVAGFDVTSTDLGVRAVASGRSGLDAFTTFAVSREGPGRPTRPSRVLAIGQTN
jgi:hypothetical protein